MKMMVHAALCAAICVGAAAAAEPAAVSVSKIYDSQLTSLEKEFVPLVEAMPADKFDFAPTQGEFQGVRSFGLQAKHVSYVIYEICAGMLGEKVPSETAAHENGPAALKTKAEVVKYVKDAFAYGHKAMAALTNANQLEQVPSPFGEGKVSRAYLASTIIWHSYDHYGQMVVYSRMNGVIPPASR